MTITRHADGGYADKCLDCGHAGNFHVTNPRSDGDTNELRCPECGATGSKTWDRLCIEDWDTKYEGSVGVLVVNGDGKRTLTGGVTYSDPNDKGIFTTVEPA